MLIVSCLQRRQKRRRKKRRKKRIRRMTDTDPAEVRLDLVLEFRPVPTHQDWLAIQWREWKAALCGYFNESLGFTNGSFTLPETDWGTDSDSCPVQRWGVGICVQVCAIWRCSHRVFKEPSPRRKFLFPRPRPTWYEAWLTIKTDLWGDGSYSNTNIW